MTLLFVSILHSYGVDYYWVGNSGNWSDYQSHWATTSGGSTFHSQVPTSNDNVFFDANSFVVAGQIVALDQTIEYCLSMDWTGATNSPTFSLDKELQVYGSLKFINNMVVTGTGTTKFLSSISGNTITSAGHEFEGDVIFDGLGGVWTLQDSLTVADSSWVYEINFLNGTLNSNNQKVTASEFWVRNSATLNMGSSVFLLTGAGWTTVGTPTINPGTSTIILERYVGNPYPYISFQGGSLHNYYNLIASPGSFPAYISGTNNTFNKIHLLTETSFGIHGTTDTFHVEAGVALTKNINLTLTVNDYFFFDGNCTSYIVLKTNTSGVESIFNSSSATMNINYTTFQDIEATGFATFTANNSFDLGGNTGWTINSPTAQNMYWIGGNGDWSNPNNWSLTSGGSPGTCVPAPTDNAYFDGNSFNSAGQTVTVDVVSNCKSIDWTGATNNPNFSIANDINIFGSITFITNMSTSDIGTVSLKSQFSGNTITSAGQIFYGQVIVDGISGDYTLLDSLTLNPVVNYGRLQLINGMLNTNDQKITCPRLHLYSGAVFNMGSSTVLLTDVTVNWWVIGTPVINTGTSTIIVSHLGNVPANIEFRGGIGYNYYNLETAGPGFAEVSGTGISFNKVSLMVSTEFANPFLIDSLIVEGDVVFSLDTAATLTVNDYVLLNGNCTSRIDFNSSSNGTAASIICSTGTISASYTTFRDIGASGGASFTSNNSYDLGGNSGWTINAATPTNHYWIGGSGNWSNPSNWSLTSGGVAGTCIPGPQDDVFFDGNSFPTFGQIVSIDKISNCANMDWAGANFNPTLDFVVELNVYGSLSLIPNMVVISGFGRLTFKSISPGNTIISAGRLMPCYLTFDGIGGEWTLQDSIVAFINMYKCKLEIKNGTLNLNDQYLNVGKFWINDGAILNMSNSVVDLGQCCITPS
ncbi:MAG: hypothetical protein JKX73_04745, partial [Flavobacteriales bacterium]|nr:hypothetical protein [Flavobacteriales bacterium]